MIGIRDRLARLNAVVTYKPDWHLQWMFPLDVPGTVQLQVRAQLPNVKTGERVLVANTTAYAVPQIERMSDDQLCELMRIGIVKLELHEVDEFFKLDGVCVTDPHPELAAR